MLDYGKVPLVCVTEADTALDNEWWCQEPWEGVEFSLPGAGGQVGEKETASVLKEWEKDTGAFVDLVTGR